MKAKPLFLLHLAIAAFLLLAIGVAAICCGDERAEARRLAPKYGVAAENIEKRLDDGTRVDLLGEEFAIEIDWAPKWCEAVGQCLHYALVTGKRPAIILLQRDAGDARHVERCERVCRHVQFIRDPKSTISSADRITVFVEQVPPKPDLPRWRWMEPDDREALCRLIMQSPGWDRAAAEQLVDLDQTLCEVLRERWRLKPPTLILPGPGREHEPEPSVREVREAIVEVVLQGCRR